MSSSGYAAMSPRRPAGAPSEHMYATMTEEELSQSLIYLTCPICEQVFSKEPVFTPCHHTFCSDCIRQRIESGDRTCAECRRPLTLGELQPNTMAINLLSTMKSCCIYRNNGCRWKGLVKDLAAHHKECSFAVTQCPYGCGARSGDPIGQTGSSRKPPPSALAQDLRDARARACTPVRLVH